MPIYEYKCQDCGTKFEKIRSIKDADEKIPCEKCRSSLTHRVASACFSKIDGGTSSASSGGCAGCSGGTCSSCGH